ncbi:hypothetical protein ABXM48_13300, partial [Enterococcus faecium]
VIPPAIFFYYSTLFDSRFKTLQQNHSKNITEIKDLIDYAMSERFDDWFPLLCDNSAYIIGQYIKSNRHGGSVNSKINKG